MIRKLTILCAIAAVSGGAAAVPAGAQAPAYKYKVGEAERAMDDFASCVVRDRSRRERAERLLRMLPSDPAHAAATRELASDRCVPSKVAGRTEMRFQPTLFRASLYSALYRRDFGRQGPGDVSTKAPLVVAAEFDGSGATVPDDLFFMRSVGDCAARADAPGVHALLLTPVSSKQERPALDRLAATLGNCVPAGRELRFSRSMLRGILAEGLYKLRKAPVAAAPASGGGAAR